MESDPHNEQSKEENNASNSQAKWSGRAEPLPDPYGDWRDELIPLPDGFFTPPKHETVADPEPGLQPNQTSEIQQSGTSEPHEESGPPQPEVRPPSGA